MVEKYGREIRPHLPDIWAATQKHLDAIRPDAGLAHGIKNAVTDAETDLEGIDRVEHGLKTDHGQLWDKAEKTATQNPNAANDLVTDLENKRRPATGEENALLLRHRIGLERDLASARQARDAAEASGNHEETEAQSLRMARVADEKARLREVLKGTGYEQGLSLQTRKMLADRDYNLLSMMDEKRAAGTGEPLTPEQTKQVEAVHDKIVEATKGHEDLLAGKEVKEAKGAYAEHAAEVEAKVRATDAVDAKQGKPPRRPTVEDIGKQKTLFEDSPKAPEDLSNYAKKLEEMFLRQGVRDREERIGKVHEAIKEVAPEMTRRETMDALSNYGKYKLLDKDAIKVALRQGHGEMQQIAKLEDMTQGQAPLKTGMERREPSDTERALIKQVNEMKKKLGFNVTDPARQLKTALETQKTRLNNAIRDIESELASGQRAVKGKTPPPQDAETVRLKARLEDLRTQRDNIFGKTELTDEQRLSMATKAVEKSIAETERRIKEGDLFPAKKDSKVPPSAELDAIKAKRDALKEQLKELQLLAKPNKTPDEIRLQAMKTRTKNRIEELTGKLARGDFSTKQRRPIELDPEATASKAALERIKQDWDTGLRKDRLAKRTKWEKLLDGFASYRRGIGVLSSPTVLPKLVAAAATRAVTMPAEQFLNSMWGKVLPKLSAKAPLEGGMNIQAEAKAASQTINGLMKGAWQKLRTGDSDLDVLHGNARTSAANEFTSFFGHLHGALKEPIRRAAFFSAQERLLAHAMENGVDVTNPLELTRISTAALEYADAQIFQQSNRLARGIRAFEATLEAKDKNTGKTPVMGKIGATATRVVMPIRNVPTNIVSEIGQYAFGLPSGILKAARAIHIGAENVTPQEADTIFRHLSKGSVGAAALLTGFFAPQHFGGYYTGKRDPNDAKPGSINIGGVNIPSLLLHNPLLEVFQIGATLRKVYDAKTGQGYSGLGAAASATGHAAAGAIQQVPLVREAVDVSKLTGVQTMDKAALEYGKSLIVPQAVLFGMKQLGDGPSSEFKKSSSRNPYRVNRYGGARNPYSRKAG